MTATCDHCKRPTRHYSTCPWCEDDRLAMTIAIALAVVPAVALVVKWLVTR